MKIQICQSKEDLGQHAATEDATLIRKAIAQQGHANIIVATGASQYEMLSALVQEPNIDWPRVTAFHLDEYIGMPETHPASFRKYLKERFADQILIGVFHYVNGEGLYSQGDVHGECQRLSQLISAHPIDVAFVGIGENGHLAFNDPPADFDTEEAYIIVNLDEDCRKQQLGEGWFSTLDDVPQQAISMSIRQIMKSKHIICSVPDERKAHSVQGTLEGPITPTLPASMMQQHPHISLYLDTHSGKGLSS
jgi:glucosamine-6-phosphate deaminase